MIPPIPEVEVPCIIAETGELESGGGEKVKVANEAFPPEVSSTRLLLLVFAFRHVCCETKLCPTRLPSSRAVTSSIPLRRPSSYAV